MSLRFVDEIVSAFEFYHSQDAARAREAADLLKFRRMWRAVYPQTANFTSAGTEKIVRRLLRLGRCMRERFWDFYISAYLLPDAVDGYTDVAIRLLAHACARHEGELRFCLDRSKPLFSTVVKSHRLLFDPIQSQMSQALPPTPPLSQAEMARVLGVSYCKFRSDVRLGRWVPLPDDAVKHRRRRRWRHSLPERQADALRCIRKRLSKRIWAELPAELPNLVSDP